MRSGRSAELLAEVEANLSRLEPDVLLQLARQATKRQRWSDALQLWRLIAQRGSANISLRRLMNAQIDCAAKLGIAGYHPEIPTVAHATSTADQANCGRRPRTRNRDPRHIAIAGIPFCGSTLLSLALGGLPGIANVGESHWLIEKRVNRTSQEPPLTTDGYEQCMSCGAACPIVTADLRNLLADATVDFYAVLSTAYAADTILTSDKYYHHILRLDPALQNDAIVLFRHPMANWESHCERKPTGASPEGQRKFLKNWAAAYSRLLDYFNNRGTKIVVDFDEFTKNPERVLALICKRLSLPFDPATLAYWRTRQHYVGGNLQLALRRHAGDDSELRIKSRSTPRVVKPVPDAEDEFAHALNVWEHLRQSHVRSLGI